MILDAIKSFGSSNKSVKPGKPGKKGAAPKMDKKKSFLGDTGSKETIKDSSKTKEKKSSPPPPPKKNSIPREKTP
jgi:hypothetical protein